MLAKSSVITISWPLGNVSNFLSVQSDHPDYEDVRAALEAMRSVATLVNERKRRMESLEKLAAWQQRVEGWEVRLVCLIDSILGIFIYYFICL